MEKTNAIKSMNLAEKPTVTAGEINSRVSVLEREVDYFLMRVKRWRPPVPKMKPTNETTANATASDKPANESAAGWLSNCPLLGCMTIIHASNPTSSLSRLYHNIFYYY